MHFPSLHAHFVARIDHEVSALHVTWPVQIHFFRLSQLEYQLCPSTNWYRCIAFLPLNIVPAGFLPLLIVPYLFPKLLYLPSVLALWVSTCKMQPRHGILGQSLSRMFSFSQEFAWLRQMSQSVRSTVLLERVQKIASFAHRQKCCQP